MPSLGFRRNDLQVAAVVTNVGNSRSNAAAPVTADAVKELRG
jgi:hypothetical protein